MKTDHKDPYGGKSTGHKEGGPTSMDRKKYGRNMSRALNQKSSSHKSGGRGQ